MSRPIGIPMSVEEKKRRSIFMTGESNPAKRLEVRKKISEKLKGRIFTEEHKKNIGLAGKGRIAWNKGINNSNKEWYRILRKTVFYYAWRETVFARDDWTCQSCGVKSKKGIHVELHPHHIMSVRRNRELALDIENGVTLCIDCHKGYHIVNGGFQNA